MMEDWRVEHFDCVCFDYEHSFRVAFDPKETSTHELEVWLEHTWPARQGWWQRLYAAAKYVLRGERNWTYGSVILRHSDVMLLRRFLMEFDHHYWELKRKELKDDAGQKSGL